MKAKLNRIFLSLLIAGVMSFGVMHTAFAAYGTGNYGACNYQTQECPAGAAASAGAPDTGQAPASMFWPIVAGIIGFLLVSFVVIRYLNRNRVVKE